MPLNMLLKLVRIPGSSIPVTVDNWGPYGSSTLASVVSLLASLGRGCHFLHSACRFSMWGDEKVVWENSVFPVVQPVDNHSTVPKSRFNKLLSQCKKRIVVDFEAVAPYTVLNIYFISYPKKRCISCRGQWIRRKYQHPNLTNVVYVHTMVEPPRPISNREVKHHLAELVLR